MPVTGQSLGIVYLEGFWSRRLPGDGKVSGPEPDQSHRVNDETLLCGLSLELRETLAYLRDARPTLQQFEQWILEQNGGSIAPSLIDRINDAIAGRLPHHASGAGGLEPALTPEDLAFWGENGYVILHDAATPDNCRAAVAAIYEALDATPDDPGSWYRRRIGHTIWVPLWRHPALAANRHSTRIHRAFAQIWGRDDLWVNTDQCGFNPPERPDWRFPGPYLHWDTSLALPLTFGTQAILYLTDTDADQGAFQCVPGFHHRIEAWLRALPPDVNPRERDLSAQSKPIAGRAGDLLIWNDLLPHGSSPNRAKRPRVVQYLNLRPSQWDFNPVWK